MPLYKVTFLNKDGIELGTIVVNLASPPTRANASAAIVAIRAIPDYKGIDITKIAHWSYELADTLS